MQKHPKCKTCGKEHALGGCPEFQSVEARKVAAVTTVKEFYPPASIDAHPKPKIGRPGTGFNKKEYNRQFTADLRTIKRQGLNMTVAQYRESLK